MTKKILYSTWGILGTFAIGGVALTSVYATKYNNLKKGLNFSGNRVKINMYKDIKDTTPSCSKIYTVAKSEKTLEDLMLDHNEDFILSPPGTFGRMVNSIFGEEAIYTKNKSWWQIASQTYLIEHPQNKLKPGSEVKTPAPYSLNIGVSGISLSQNNIINFYKTPA